jgi:hypothetical protein
LFIPGIEEAVHKGDYHSMYKVIAATVHPNILMIRHTNWKALKFLSNLI